MTNQINEDFRLSVSKAKTFNQCKKQYQFNYILKFPKKERDYHIFGKFCHQVLEVFHLRYQEGCTKPYNIVMGEAWKDAWAEYKEKMTTEMKKECWDIINNYLKIISTTIPTNTCGMPGNVIGIEKKFELPIAENIILNGAIDRVQLDDDNILHIADYKTTKNLKYLSSDWFQLLTYAYVMASEDPSIKKIRGSYILLRHNFKYITKEFSIEEIMEVKDKILALANSMQLETEFPANPNNLCGWCEYLEHCLEGRSKVANSFSGAKNVFGEVGY